MIDYARIRREAIRWYLIVAANVSRPQGLYVEGMLPVVQAVYADATEHELKRELDYLEERQLVSIQRDGMERWFVTLTRHGIDLAEYTTAVEPGIARPKALG
jgi:predicted component of type VI protein secretion system